MNPMIKKYVDDNFMTEEEGQYIEDAIMNKESIVVSGHRSSGVRPLFANLMAVAKKNFNGVQVKKAEDLEKDAEFYLIPASDDLESMISGAIATGDSAIVTLKEPEHPISLIKILKTNFKQGKGGINKKIHTLECRKENDIPFLDKITEMHIDENGKVVKTDFQK
ncbi:MAG: hypothetical protein PHY91_08760 [Tissierellia bacterium]|nr:hypothetical protein [Tissierellia bacterium]MDD4726062.1 hypothetical protein [Tissierellia bacterium]